MVSRGLRQHKLRHDGKAEATVWKEEEKRRSRVEQWSERAVVVIWGFCGWFAPQSEDNAHMFLVQRKTALLQLPLVNH